MKKHLGWALRMLIAVAGVAYILSTLSWSDQVWLPAGYVAYEQVNGGSGGRSFDIYEETADAYWIGYYPDPGRSRISYRAWIPKADLVTAGDGPRFEPSFITIVQGANKPLLFGGLALVFPAFVIGALRWVVLMRARGIEMPWLRAYRLTMAGVFFNLCMPGTTGGDVMKAYYAAKGTHRRADAVVSVAVDRVCGLIGLLLLVGIIGLVSLDDPLVRRITLVMWAVLIGFVFVAWLYASPLVRARIRLGGLIGRVPGAGMLRKIDALVSGYRHHVGALVAAVGLSLPIHLALSVAMIMAGYALEIEQPVVYLLGMVPVVFMLWSLPISGPLGLGPLDYLAVQLIVAGSATSDQQAVMMFVAYRLCLVAVGLCGSLALLGSDAPSSSAGEDTELEPEAGAATG